MASLNCGPKNLGLGAVYRKINIPVDSLAADPTKLAEFAVEMEGHGFHWTPEVTLRELFRARKSGSLPKIRH